MILAFFDQQVTPILPIKFRVNGPFYSGEVKIDFQDGNRGSHLVFQIGTILAIFDLQVDDTYQVSSQLAYQLRRRSEK